MILVRLILIFFIVYLLVKGFIKSLSLDDRPPQENNNRNNQKFGNDAEKPKKVSKSIGEYVDYEESKKKESGRS